MKTKLLSLKFSELKHRVLYQKIVSVVVVALFVFIFALKYVTFTDSLIWSTLDGVVTMLQLLVIVLSTVLSALLGEVYWINVRKSKIDERLLAQRRRIFERSYQILAVLIGLAILFVSISLDSFVAQYKSAETNPNILVESMFFLYALPSIVAAWMSEN